MKVVMLKDVEGMDSQGKKFTFKAGQTYHANEGKGMGQDGVWVRDRNIAPRFKTFLSKHEYQVL
jgi:hypothetical protein